MELTNAGRIHCTVGYNTVNRSNNIRNEHCAVIYQFMPTMTSIDNDNNVSEIYEPDVQLLRKQVPVKYSSIVTF